MHISLRYYDVTEDMVLQMNNTRYKRTQNSTFYKVENILVQRNQKKDKL